MHLWGIMDPMRADVPHALHYATPLQQQDNSITAHTAGHRLRLQVGDALVCRDFHALR